MYFLCFIDWYIFGNFIVSINIWIFFFMTIVASCVCRMIIVKLFVIIVIIFNSRTCDWKTRREGFTHYYLLLESSLSGCMNAAECCVLRDGFNCEMSNDGGDELLEYEEARRVWEEIFAALILIEGMTRQGEVQFNFLPSIKIVVKWLSFWDFPFFFFFGCSFIYLIGERGYWQTSGDCFLCLAILFWQQIGLAANETKGREIKNCYRPRRGSDLWIPLM